MSQFGQWGATDQYGLNWLRELISLDSKMSAANMPEGALSYREASLTFA